MNLTHSGQSRTVPDVPVVEVEHIGYRYGDRQALSDVSFTVDAGEIFALLGPNGSGKTTLFRILSTLYAPGEGSARIFGFDIRGQARQVRERIGIVFQSPSLDMKLTVAENLTHHGHLYGLRGRALATRIQEMMERLRIADRAGDLIETLSGGLARRAELAKGLLHEPKLLILDEPSVGLDPGARHDLWAYLSTLSRDDGITILVTTHMIDEADRAHRVLVLNRGGVVALDAPGVLKSQIGGDIISLTTGTPEDLAKKITHRFGVASRVLDGSVRLEKDDGPGFIPALFESFPGLIESVTVARPTLEDVFIQRTGHRLWEEEP